MVDVCLILEGTWPYVKGGVSTWVDQLIRGLPHLKFGILHIAAGDDKIVKPLYVKPDNVQWILTLPLHGPVKENEFSSGGQDPLVIQRAKYLSTNMDSYWKSHFQKMAKDKASGRNFEEAFYSKETWQTLLARYEQNAEDQSFIDYLWTWRFIALPIWRLIDFQIPEAKIYHSISTGYAGFLGGLASWQWRRPYILTEHGIYTREREIEIQTADWIYQDQDPLAGIQRKSYFRKWWTEHFHFLNRFSYSHSNKIISLYDENRRIQIKMGAPEDKCEVIPNGVYPEFYSDARVRYLKRIENKSEAFTLLFAGRIVPIKDIKNLLRAFSIVKNEFPTATLLLLGPMDEDKDYATACRALSNSLDLDNSVFWTGMVQLKDHFDRGDLLVLSSLSEAQPLVILEAACVGIPAVATHVGSCAELLEGASTADKSLGYSGLTCPVGRPDLLASKIIELFRDKEKRLEMGEVAFKRVQKFYRQDLLMARYHNLYYSYLNQVM